MDNIQNKSSVNNTITITIDGVIESDLNRRDGLWKKLDILDVISETTKIEFFTSPS